jgi:hypothetical protein
MAWIPGTNPPNWIPQSYTIDRYRQIADFIKKINTDPRLTRNLVSRDAIQNMIERNEIYSLNPDTNYDRSGVVLTPPPLQLQVMGGPGGQVFGPLIYDPHRTYMPVYNDDDDSDQENNNKSDDEMMVEKGGRVKKSRTYRNSKKSRKSKKSKKSRKSKKSKKSRK